MRGDTPRLRLAVVGVVAVSLFGALFARLWYLQVLASPEYQVQAESNQQRTVIEPAPRGRILDRNGVAIVDNRISFVVGVDRQRLDDLDDGERDDVLRRMVVELNSVDPSLTVGEVEDRLASDRYSPYVPVPVMEDVPEPLAAFLTERSDEFGGVVSVESRPIRTYPFGRTASHVIGYVGPINDEEYEARRDSDEQYQLTDEIGKSGIERTFEEDLRGTPGRRVLEVDAQGNPVRELSYTPPVPGHDVVLSIDLTVQAIAEQALEEELAAARERRVSNGNPPNVAPAGSVVVEDPINGTIVAMASYPDFDPAAFTDGIDNAEWAALNDPASFYPLINRAIEGQYAPGSTFKLISAYAGLTAGLITPTSPFNDRGVYTIQECRGESCTFRNAGSVPHGTVDLREALTVSSDTYFYDIGARLWFNRSATGDAIQASATLFGLGADTGIALPNEKSGRVMTPEEFAQRHLDNPDAFPRERWQAGDNVNIAVGQGEMLATPLQMATAYAALASGGNVYAPNIVLRVQRAGTDEVVRSYEPRVLRQVPFPPDWYTSFMDGFRGVTTVSGGTAVSAFRGFPEGWIVAGKTGTAQVQNKADTALFVAMGPAGVGQVPQFVAAAVLEESGFGGVAAAPLVRRIFEPLADPALIPTIQPCRDTLAGCGAGVLTAPLAAGADPLADGDVLD